MDEQISMLEVEEIDLRAQYKQKQKEAAIQEKLQRDYVEPYKLWGYCIDDIPSGIVMIVRSLYDRGNKYYRVVTGHHRTVSGPMLHIISAPNDEWPNVPPWQASHGVQWVYPDNFVLLVKRDPETDTPAWDE